MMISEDSKSIPGNLLGGARAEIDKKMLDNAFIFTHDFRALVNTRDFNFIVGRRGTGKSALFLKVSEFIKEKKMGYVYCKAPSEYESLELQSVIKNITCEYRVIRAITRVVWRVSILIGLLQNLLDHYKISKCANYDFLNNYRIQNKEFLRFECFKKCTEIIKKYTKEYAIAEEIPGVIASTLQIEKLHKSISNALSGINKVVYFFFDGLDEGWCPNEVATALLGGLAACASDFLEKQCGVHILLFIRDNIFRALNYFDGDFSRHIEGNTLRLNWDESSLLHFICNRLRVVLGLEKVESDVKIWNRFAHANLKNREGFNSCQPRSKIHS